MSAKTKIVVLHMKELIYTGIFAALGILFIVLMLIMFLPDKAVDESTTPPVETDTTIPTDSSASTYIPGIYTTELSLGNQTLDVEVIVNQEAITSIRLVDPSEAVTTMYPLLSPTLSSIREQIYETQSFSDIRYASESKYTSLVLLEAIKSAVQKAQPVAIAD
ncbi:MAG: hypothetical protein IJ747_04745 [Lachnospiraceae bacterium]|nr:hypothetical protein [Lachnospiraceae bacterium]